MKVFKKIVAGIVLFEIISLIIFGVALSEYDGSNYLLLFIVSNAATIYFIILFCILAWAIDVLFNIDK